MEQFAWTFLRISGALPLPWRLLWFLCKPYSQHLSLMILKMLSLHSRSAHSSLAGTRRPDEFIIPMVFNFRAFAHLHCVVPAWLPDIRVYRSVLDRGLCKKNICWHWRKGVINWSTFSRFINSSTNWNLITPCHDDSGTEASWDGFSWGLSEEHSGECQWWWEPGSWNALFWVKFYAPASLTCPTIRSRLCTMFTPCEIKASIHCVDRVEQLCSWCKTD